MEQPPNQSASVFQHILRCCAYLFLYGKLILTLSICLFWYLDFVNHKLSGPGWGLFLTVFIVLSILTGGLSLLLLRLSMRKYRPAILLVLSDIAIVVAFYGWDTFIPYSRDW